MDLELANYAKPIAALGALLLFGIGERLLPASRAGAGTLRHDVRNLSLGALNGVLGVALAVWLLPSDASYGGGLLGTLQVSGAAYWLLGFVLLDLWTFVWHRMSHGFPLLWRVHRAHHTDRAMDASTALRFHPIETTLSALLRVPVAWALGLGWTHIALYEAVLLPVILFHHSNLRVPARLDRVLRWVVVTPALHRIHHSLERVETNSNFGGVLTIWDRLARTLRGASIHSEVRFGVVGCDAARWQSWPGILATPFRPLFGAADGLGRTTAAVGEPTFGRIHDGTARQEPLLPRSTPRQRGTVEHQ